MMLNPLSHHDDLMAEVEVELVIDDASAGLLPPIPSAPTVLERLRVLELEQRAAYSQMHRMVADIGALKSGNERWVRELELVQADAMYRLALVAEYRSGGGAAKVLRIGVMSAMLANALGCDEHFCDRLQAAAPLHDVGEISLPDSMFSAPALSDMERELMRSHCLLGNALLADSIAPDIGMAAEIALGHHERYDGSGYPHHLAGDDIPMACRIVAVIDCFDALTMKRPYRPAYKVAVAAEMIMAGSGFQFDPAVIEGFRQVIESLLLVRSVLDENNLRPETMKWLGKPPEPGFWRRFL